jgi:hypothetical protein
MGNIHIYPGEEGKDRFGRGYNRFFIEYIATLIQLHYPSCCSSPRAKMKNVRFTMGFYWVRLLWHTFREAPMALIGVNRAD